MSTDFRRDVKIRCVAEDVTLRDVAVIAGWPYGRLQKKLGGFLPMTVDEQEAILAAVELAAQKQHSNEA